MALREDFENTGNWLFKWRSYLPLIMIGIFLLAMTEYHYPRLHHIWEILCLIVSFFGLGIRVFTIGHTPKRTSGRNSKHQVAESLNTTGIYSVVRHPLYVGNFFIGLGWVLFINLWWLILIYILAFCLYYERIIFAEEEFLRNKFGNEYIEWANQTPVFIPRFSQYKKADLPFSFRNVLKREYNGLLTVVIVMYFLEVVGDFFVKGKFDYDFGWILLVLGSFIIWFILRYFKKHTRVLHVEGR